MFTNRGSRDVRSYGSLCSTLSEGRLRCDRDACDAWRLTSDEAVSVHSRYAVESMVDEQLLLKCENRRQYSST